MGGLETMTTGLQEINTQVKLTGDKLMQVIMEQQSQSLITASLVENTKRLIFGQEQLQRQVEGLCHGLEQLYLEQRVGQQQSLPTLQLPEHHQPTMGQASPTDPSITPQFQSPTDEASVPMNIQAYGPTGVPSSRTPPSKPDSWIDL